MKRRSTCPNCGQKYPNGYWEKKEKLRSENLSKSLRAAKARGENVGRKKIRDDKFIRALRKKGLSIRAIAKEIKMSPYTVQCSLKGEKNNG